MKKVFFAFLAALAVLSACQKTPALPVVQFDKSNYIMDSDDPLTVKIVCDQSLSESVDFTLAGTATLGEDYTVSETSAVKFDSAAEAQIVFTPLNNLSDKNIKISLTAKSGAYTLGTNSSATIVITPKEKVYCSFSQSAYHLVDETEISMKLVGATSGESFKAVGSLKIPFKIEGTAVEGTDFEIVGGEKALVAENGGKEAKVKIKSLLSELPATLPTLKLVLDESNERFISGVNAGTEIAFGSTPVFGDFVGKWYYSSYPLKDDSAADKATFDALIDDAGDTWEANIPCKNTANDIIEFKVKDGKNSLLVSGTGDIFDYLQEAEVTKVASKPYTWYFYYNPAQPWDSSVELTLSKVNYDFDKTAKTLQEGKIILNLSEDGKTLDLVIPATSYDPVKGNYFKNIRAYADGLVWSMYVDSGYWDCYYVFKKVEE